MAKKNAAWTVMVYLAGDNNPSTECMFALTEMKEARVGKAETLFADAGRLRSEQQAASNREAIKKYREAAELWRAAGKLNDATIALRNAGELLQLLAETSSAKNVYEDALTLTKQTRNQGEEARVRNDLAYLHFIAGNTTKAQRHAFAALKIGKVISDRTIEATALSNLGETFFVLYNLVKAQEHQQQSLAIFRELNNQRGQAIALIALGYYYHNLDQPAEALNSCNDGLTLARSAKDLEAETLALLAITNIKRKLGDPTAGFDAAAFAVSERARARSLLELLRESQTNVRDTFDSLPQPLTLKETAGRSGLLSACSTALGKDIRGEGLVGITRGFTYAGAAGVVASLWKVDDEATAELMKHFYVALFNKDMPPAAALRDAQLELAKHPRWHSPYYWAGFVIQGQYDQNEKSSQSSIGASEIAVLAVLGIALLLASIVLHKLRRRRTRGYE